MTLTPDAPVFKAVKRFPEIRTFDTPFPGSIVIRLNKRVDEARKEKIVKAAKRCKFNEVVIKEPTMAVIVYQKITKEEKLRISERIAAALKELGINEIGVSM